MHVFVFLNYWKNFVGTEKRVWIIHGKQAICVRAIEVILCLVEKAPYLNYMHWWAGFPKASHKSTYQWFEECECIHGSIIGYKIGLTSLKYNIKKYNILLIK